MRLAVDADISDLWTIRVLIVRGSTLSSDVFNTILRCVVPLSSSIPLSSLAESDTNSVNELSPFLKWYRRLPCARISISFIPQEYYDRAEKQDAVPSEISGYHLSTHIQGYLVVDQYPQQQEEQELCKTVDRARNAMSSIYPETRFLHAIYIESVTDDDAVGEEQPEVVTLGHGIWKVDYKHLKQLLPLAVYASARRLTAQLLVTAQQLTRHDAEHQIGQSGTAVTAASRVALSKNYIGWQRKKIADLYLLVGQPLAALQVYHEVIEFARLTNDTLCVGACYESEAAAVRLYSLLPTETPSELPRFTGLPTSHELPGSPAATPREITTASALPIEIERLTNETSKRWPFSFPMSILSGSAQTDDLFRSSHLLTSTQHLFPVHHGKDTIPFIDAPQSTSDACSRSASLLHVVISKLRDAVAAYQKAGSGCTVLAAESLLRITRLLAMFPDVLPCLDSMSRLYDETKALSVYDQERLLIAAASVAFSVKARRHFALFLLRVTWMELQHHVNPTALNFVYLVTSCCFLGDLFFFDTNRTPTDTDSYLQSQVAVSNCVSIRSSSDHENNDFLIQLRRVRNLFRSPGGQTTTITTRDFVYHRVAQYGPNHASFFKRHLACFQLGRLGAAASQDVLWPAIQLGVLKTLCRVCLELKHYEAAAYTIFLTISKCYPVLSSASIKSLFELLSFYIKKTKHKQVCFPFSLTLLPKSSFSPPSPVHRRRQRRTTRVMKKDPAPVLTFIGGTSQSSCPPIPTLTHIRIDRSCYGKGRWNVDFNPSQVYRCVHANQGLIKDGDQQTTSEASIAVDVNPSLSSSRRNFDSEAKDTMLRVSPWRRGGDVEKVNEREYGSKSKEHVSLQSTDHVWVVGEPQTLTLIIQNLLNICITIDSITILALGGSLETVPAKIELPAASSSVLSSSSDSVCAVNVTVIPHSTGNVSILGVHFNIGGAIVSQLLVVDSPNVQRYVSRHQALRETLKNEQDCFEYTDEALLHSEEIVLLGSSCCVQADVVPPIPFVSHNFLIAPDPGVLGSAPHVSGISCCVAPLHWSILLSTSSTVTLQLDHGSTQLSNSSCASSQSLVAVNNTSNQPVSLRQQCFLLPFDVKALPSLSRYGVGSFCVYLSLTNTSSTRCLRGLNLRILTSASIEGNSLTEQILGRENPKTLFLPCFETKAGYGFHDRLLSQQSGTKVLEFGEARCLGNVTTFPLTVCSQQWQPFLDVKRSNTALEFSRPIQPREVICVPLIMRFGLVSIQEAAVAVGYTDDDEEFYRYMIIPFNATTQFPPPLYVECASLSVIHDEPFSVLPLMTAVVDSGEFSDKVTTCFDSLLKRSSIAADEDPLYIFNDSQEHLGLTLNNSTSQHIDCFTHDDLLEQHSAILPPPSQLHIKCPALSKTRWAVPIRRDDLHAFFTLPNNAFCSTSSNTPADQLSRSASMPLLKSRGASLAESVALHVLSRLRYRTQSGHMVPLTLKVDHENSAAPSYISLDAAGLLPCSVSAAAHLPSRLPAVRSPISFNYVILDATNGRSYTPLSDGTVEYDSWVCVRQVPLFCPIVITVTVTRKRCSASSLTSDVTTNTDSEPFEATVVAIPFETLRVERVTWRHRNDVYHALEPVSSIADSGLLWTGSLERHITVKDSTTSQFIFTLTSTELRHTLFFACICHSLHHMTIIHASFRVSHRCLLLCAKFSVKVRAASAEVANTLPYNSGSAGGSPLTLRVLLPD